MSLIYFTINYFSIDSLSKNNYYFKFPTAFIIVINKKPFLKHYLNLFSKTTKKIIFIIVVLIIIIIIFQDFSRTWVHSWT